MFTVEFYVKEDKTVPVEEFIMSLSDKLKTKVFRDLKLLKKNKISKKDLDLAIAYKKDYIKRFVGK